MTPREIFPGNWGVTDSNGNLVVSGLSTNRESWAWIDRNSAQASEDDERNARIGRAIGS
jgi:hypothetical protein